MPTTPRSTPFSQHAATTQDPRCAGLFVHSSRPGSVSIGFISTARSFCFSGDLYAEFVRGGCCAFFGVTQ